MTKALLCASALLVLAGTGPGVATEVRYVKLDRPEVALVFHAEEGTAAVIDQSSGAVLVEGPTLIYDDPNTLRIDPAAGSACPSIDVTLGSGGDPAGARVRVRDAGTPVDGACRAADIAGTYAPAR